MDREVKSDALLGDFRFPAFGRGKLSHTSSDQSEGMFQFQTSEVIAAPDNNYSCSFQVIPNVRVQVLALAGMMYNNTPPRIFSDTKIQINPSAGASPLNRGIGRLTGLTIGAQVASFPDALNVVNKKEQQGQPIPLIGFFLEANTTYTISQGVFDRSLPAETIISTITVYWRIS
jgi:hypothetical protein